MPAQIWRISVPMSTVSFKSLSARHALGGFDLAYAHFTLVKSSMPILSEMAGAGLPLRMRRWAADACGRGCNCRFW